MKGLKMAARKNNHSFTITTHIYIATNKTNTESVGPSTNTHSCSSTSLLKSVVSFTTKKKNTCDVYNNKVPSKQGEILQREGQILLVEEVHDHPDNNTIGAILVQDFFNSIHTPPPPHPPTTVAQDTLPGRQNLIVTQEKPCLHYQEWQRNYM